MAEHLLRLGNAINSRESLAVRLTAICQSMTELLRCDRSSVFLLDGESFVAAANHGNPPDVQKLFLRATFNGDQPLLRGTLDRGIATFVPDAAASPLVSGRVVAAARVRSLIVGPIATATANHGVITAEFNETNATFSKFATVVVDGLARMAATTIDAERTSERERDLQSRLVWQADHDVLTGLPNRRLLRTWFDERTARRPDGSIILLLADLDRFKVVNDGIGHAAGDRLLTEIAERLRRAFDHREQILLARFGGDEFVIVALEASPDEAQVIADELADAFAVAVPVADGRTVRVTASAGIAVAPADEADLNELLRDADAAMYVAKKHRRGRSVFAGHDQRPVVAHRFELEVVLPDALGSGEIVPFFQPVVDVSTGQMIGVEALARWQRPNSGLVLPDGFIAIADEMGLMRDLTMTIARQARALLDRPGHDKLKIFLNLSPADLQPGLLELLTEAFDRPEQLVVEITEHTAIEQSDEIEGLLNSLRGAGISVALDDFGTGYSSLAMLLRLPLDIVKLDRELLSATSSDRVESMLHATVEMSRSLGLVVLAEGIESQAELDLVTAAGVDLVQGYFIGRPDPDVARIDRRGSIGLAD